MPVNAESRKYKFQHHVVEEEQGRVLNLQIRETNHSMLHGNSPTGCMIVWIGGLKS